jgi:hypothetical protein
MRRFSQFIARRFSNRHEVRFQKWPLETLCFSGGHNRTVYAARGVRALLLHMG